MTRHRSRDGLCASSDPAVVAQWDSIGHEMQVEQERASAELRSLGVTAEHPDDGWVDRERNTVQLVYPAFNNSAKEGDVIALGWPWSGYRLVRVTAVVRASGIFGPTTTYHFTED